MKPIIVTLWQGDEVVLKFSMNPEGLYSHLLDEEIKNIDRITVEPDDPDSRVRITPYGAVYRP